MKILPSLKLVVGHKIMLLKRSVMMLGLLLLLSIARQMHAAKFNETEAYAKKVDKTEAHAKDTESYSTDGIDTLFFSSFFLHTLHAEHCTTL